MTSNKILVPVLSIYINHHEPELLQIQIIKVEIIIVIIEKHLEKSI